MTARKEIIILNGGGHKGIVKVSAVTGRDGIAKISCSLDFRPKGAKLYLIGDNVAQITLDDTNNEAELAFSANDEIGCVLRSSSVIMYGGSGSKSEMLKKIEAYESYQKNAIRNDAAEPIPQHLYGNVKAETEGINKTESLEVNTDIKELLSDSDSDTDNKSNMTEKKEKGRYVGVSAKTDVNPLGDWTKYDGNNFYYAVKPQIDEMFICYPEEEPLVAAVPNSKWVRVDAEDGYYVVGLLFDDEEPSFICYGVPQCKTNEPVKAPPELENMCVWLPLNVSESISGYWIIYQSARTGEIIK